jgi:hypothetical protein
MVTQYAYPVEYTLLKKEYTHKKGDIRKRLRVYTLHNSKKSSNS